MVYLAGGKIRVMESIIVCYWYFICRQSGPKKVLVDLGRTSGSILVYCQFLCSIVSMHEGSCKLLGDCG